MSVRSAVAVFRGQREFHLDIIGKRRWWFLLSGTIVLISAISLLAPGLKLGIDFRGGALLSYPNRTEATVEEIRTEMAKLGHADAEVQLTGEGGVSVRTESLSKHRTEVLTALADQAGISPSDISIQDIGPQWGEQISVKALQGLIIFLVVVTIYISFRFEWKMAISALVALFHDLIITAGVYALVGKEVTPETVIAILTILGYSLYDTVVIFDKVKENAELPALVAKETYAGMVNLSLNHVLMRSVNTSLVVLFPVGALLLLGGETLGSFAFALFVGILVGTYSSIFVAAPLVAVLKEREPRMADIRARAQRRETARPALRAVPASEASGGDGERRELIRTGARPSGGRSKASGTRRKPKKKPRSKRRRR